MNRTSQPICTHVLPWMPLGDGVWARPLCFDGEARTLQLKVAPGVTIARHRHAGAVHALNLVGWRRLENGDLAGPGAYVFEPPGNEDSWTCVGDEACVVQISMTGRLTYVDQSGEALDYLDTPKLRASYLAWCRREGHSPAAIGAA